MIREHDEALAPTHWQCVQEVGTEILNLNIAGRMPDGCEEQGMLSKESDILAQF